MLCAAIWYKDDNESPRGFVAQNLSKGIVVGQWRHPNVIHAWRQASGKRTVITEVDYVDGFLTSFGNFVDRVQAAEIAFNAGQIPEHIAKNPRWNGKVASALGEEPRKRWADSQDYQFRNIYSEDIY